MIIICARRILWLVKMDGYGAIRSRSDRIITSSRISCSLGACFLGFALFTLSLQYIYTCWSLSACSCSLHTLPPSPDLNKTSLASLSPHCCSKSRQDPSAGKGRRLNAVAVGEGGNPLPALLFTFYPAAAQEGLRPLLLRRHPVAHRTTPQEP